MNRGGQSRGRGGGGGRGWTTRGGQGRGTPRDAPRSQPPLHRYSPQSGDGNWGPSANDSSGSFSKNSEYKSASSSECQPWRPKKDALSQAEIPKEGRQATNSMEIHSKELKCSVASDSGSKGDDPLLSTLNPSCDLQKGVEKMQIGENPTKLTKSSETCVPFKPEAKDSLSNQKPELSEQSPVTPSFDLCPPKPGGGIKLKDSLFVQNKEKRNKIERSKDQASKVLQSGMVLLKSYISPSDQIKIVKLCRDLGWGPGGFYQPGYRDGAKLNLKMMCLGKNWDPETNKYGDHRPHDGAKPPPIPVYFLQLVENAMKESHSLIEKESKASHSEDILPPVSPDICLVNFYSTTGRLGLHQDRDESEQSLRKCLPVVSFSIGDEAEFLYGDQRDTEKAKNIKLESGDVLIFGGKSRHIFHGVASIAPKTAAPTLLEATNIRTGRLNLTFRQY